MTVITDKSKFKYYLDKAFIDILLNSDYELYMNDPMAHAKVNTFSNLFLDIINKYNEDEQQPDYKNKKMLEMGEIKKNILTILNQMKIELGGQNEKVESDF